MIKTIPFASLIPVFSSLLGVASLTSWFQFMSSPLLSLSLFFFPAGIPFPPESSTFPWPLSLPAWLRSFLLRLPPLPLGTPPPRETWTERREWGAGQESCLRSVYQPCPQLRKASWKCPRSHFPCGGGWQRAGLSAPAPGAPPAVLAQPGHESPRRELRGAAGVPRPRLPRLGGKL